MSLPSNNKNMGKQGSGGKLGAAASSKFIAKPTSSKPTGGANKKPIKTGGSRGS